MSECSIGETLAELLPRTAVEEIITTYGDGYSALFKAEDVEWRNSYGMGPNGMKKLRAIKRLIKDLEAKKINGLSDASRPLDIYKSMQDMQYFETEHIRVLYLNNHNKLLKYDDVSIGHTTVAITDIKCVFSMAIRLKAASIIIVHNHPSGRVKPSEEDRKLTKDMKVAGEILNIPLLDHIIIGAGRYYSFSEEGKI